MADRGARHNPLCRRQHLPGLDSYSCPNITGQGIAKLSGDALQSMAYRLRQVIKHSKAEWGTVTGNSGNFMDIAGNGSSGSYCVDSAASPDTTFAPAGQHRDTLAVSSAGNQGNTGNPLMTAATVTTTVPAQCFLPSTRGSLTLNCTPHQAVTPATLPFAVNCNVPYSIRLNTLSLSQTGSNPRGGPCKPGTATSPSSRNGQQVVSIEFQRPCPQRRRERAPHGSNSRHAARTAACNAVSATTASTASFTISWKRGTSATCGPNRPSNACSTCARSARRPLSACAGACTAGKGCAGDASEPPGKACVPARAPGFRVFCPGGLRPPRPAGDVSM